MLVSLLFLIAVNVVQATIFVIKPSAGSTCHGGEPCIVEWLDDGERPLLSAIGVTTVGLFTGDQKIVQTIQPVDVSSSLSLTFTPDPKAGPNSDTYYIAFSSADFKTNGSAYLAFSPFFSLDRMSGSFASPLPSATSTIRIPSSLTESSTAGIATTITVGTLHTSGPSLSSTVQQSSTSSQQSSTFLTSTSPISMTSSTSAPGIRPTTSNSVKLRLSLALPIVIASVVLLLII